MQSGRYSTASGVMRDALRLIEERRTAKLEALRSEIKMGLDSGPAEDAAVDEMIDGVKARGRQRRATGRHGA